MDTSAEKADELDRALVQLEHGFDIAMQVSSSKVPINKLYLHIKKYQIFHSVVIL